MERLYQPPSGMKGKNPRYILLKHWNVSNIEQGPKRFQRRGAGRGDSCPPRSENYLWTWLSSTLEIEMCTQSSEAKWLDHHSVTSQHKTRHQTGIVGKLRKYAFSGSLLKTTTWRECNRTEWKPRGQHGAQEPGANSRVQRTSPRNTAECQAQKDVRPY